MEIGFTHFTGFEESGGICWWCGGDLPKRKRRWCCKEHLEAYWDTYNWRFASLACIKRADYHCVNCNISEQELAKKYRESGRLYADSFRLEVHHIIPIGGEDRSWHELNKPENLLCLCHDCHMEVHRVVNASRGKPEQMDSFEYAKIIGQGVFDLTPTGKG